MRVAIYGTGYVGLVTGACLAEVGNDVLCMDLDEQKISALNSGKVPIYEPGLDQLVATNVKAGRLAFTTDAERAVAHGLFQFIAVGTPADEDGSADLQYVLNVASTIGGYLSDYRIVVNKSTVPVGTAEQVRLTIDEALRIKDLSAEYEVVSNPEFLKEGSAIKDFMSPDRIIVGTDNPRTAELLKELYSPFNRNRDRLISMDIRSAELTKYAANAMLATKISFMNELANLAERLDADIEQVRQGIGSDSRIGFSFIYPGCGYGGSCFPKDVDALVRVGSDIGYQVELIEAVRAVNARQKQVIFEQIRSYYGADIRGKSIAIWGLSFKPNTDDMREAPSRALMEALWRHGASVRVHDPVALEECRRVYGDRPDLIYCQTPEQALQNADALAVVTEWQLYRSPDFDMIRESLNDPVIFDGRNLYEPALLKRKGFVHYAIGRARQCDVSSGAALNTAR